jgi:hypothetical protein
VKGGITVVGIGGSLSAQASSLAALKIALEGAARVERAEAQIQPITEAEASCS